MIAFGTVPGFTEDWFGLASQRALAALGESVADVGGLIVEIGSWQGRSTIALANAIHPRDVQAVDTWAGSPGEISEQLAGKRDIFASFTANIAYYTKGNVTPHRMGWREYVPTIGEPVALVFIDAEHTYREVFDAVTAVLPLMAEGGVLCGDDAHHPPIREALEDLFGLDTLEFAATLWIKRVAK